MTTHRHPSGHRHQLFRDSRQACSGFSASGVSRVYTGPTGLYTPDLFKILNTSFRDAVSLFAESCMSRPHLAASCGMLLISASRFVQCSHSRQAFYYGILGKRVRGLGAQ